jgi:hypothetical protein
MGWATFWAIFFTNLTGHPGRGMSSTVQLQNKSFTNGKKWSKTRREKINRKMCFFSGKVELVAKYVLIVSQIKQINRKMFFSVLGKVEFLAFVCMYS